MQGLDQEQDGVLRVEPESVLARLQAECRPYLQSLEFGWCNPDKICLELDKIITYDLILGCLVDNLDDSLVSSSDSSPKMQWCCCCRVEIQLVLHEVCDGC